MLWIGVCVGIGICIGIGLGLVLARVWKMCRAYEVALALIEREIAADNLACAREECRAAALRTIAANERQAKSDESRTRNQED